MKKVTFALIVFLVAFAVPVTVYSIVSETTGFDTRGEAAEEAASSNLAIPEIVSVPPTDIDLGEGYLYVIRAVDSDGDTLEYQAKQYPAWLSWDSGQHALSGTPEIGDVGTHVVELQVTDGKWLQTQKFEIAVIQTGDTAIETRNRDATDMPEADEYSLPSTTTDRDTADEYGLISQDQETASTTEVREGTVLGVSDLPKTSLFTGVIGLSVGIGLVCLAMFMWADSRWNWTSKMVSRIGYEKGRQIEMEVDGIVVQKRKIRI